VFDWQDCLRRSTTNGSSICCRSCFASSRPYDDFLRRPVTPRSAFQLERRLARLLWEFGRRLVARACNRIEPGAAEMPARLRLGREDYRRNRKTSRDVFCLFGKIRLKRFVYQAVDGGPGFFPLEHALGVVAHLATPALADQVGQLTAELTQQQTLAVLRERFRVHLSVGALRKVAAQFAEVLSPLRHDAQVTRLLELLSQAAASRGRFRPSLVAGRDGVMVPTRPCWEEASTATVSIHDRRGRRLGTVYLGRMPEFGQATMTAQLKRLIGDVLAGWEGPLPRLHYVTDAGHHPQEFYRRELAAMKHPRTGQRLKWTWAVDYYHAAERISTLAEALFGAGREASSWGEKMRSVLKNKNAGVTRLLQTAQALRRARGLRGRRKEFDEAIHYLRKYTRHMNYAACRRVGLPIGSGVTEAACKTIFGYRFKQSGMRWNKDSGQHVLDLRLLLKSNVWNNVRDAWLNAFQPCHIVNTAVPATQTPQNPLILTLPA
jgi:hypothetical protein